MIAPRINDQLQLEPLCLGALPEPSELIDRTYVTDLAKQAASLLLNVTYLLVVVVYALGLYAYRAGQYARVNDVREDLADLVFDKAESAYVAVMDYRDDVVVEQGNDSLTAQTLSLVLSALDWVMNAVRSDSPYPIEIDPDAGEALTELFGTESDDLEDLPLPTETLTPEDISTLARAEERSIESPFVVNPFDEQDENDLETVYLEADLRDDN
jgi:hypothetical protein